MEKKYKAPEIKVMGFQAEDIIQASGITITSEPKTIEGAARLEDQLIEIFQGQS